MNGVEMMTSVSLLYVAAVITLQRAFQNIRVGVVIVMACSAYPIRTLSESSPDNILRTKEIRL